MRTEIPLEQLIVFDSWTVASRLFLTVLFCGIIGWQREMLRKPAGFRTHILVGVGACLLMMVSLYVPSICRWSNVDPGRIAAQVVVGIGFLGAGTILHHQGGVVSGLTTAASLWVAAALGLAVGIGFFQGATMAWFAVMLVLLVLNRVDAHIEENFYHTLIVRGRFTFHTLEQVKRALRESRVSVIKSEFGPGEELGRVLVVSVRPVRVNRSEVVAQSVRRVPGIREVLFQS
jgi:putative Mg2+ transporter-C (MgtC) family protein